MRFFVSPAGFLRMTHGGDNARGIRPTMIITVEGVGDGHCPSPTKTGKDHIHSEVK